MKPGKLLILTFLYLFIHTGASAQGSFRFTRLSTEEGLSNSCVSSQYQDEFGMMWIGTQDGLNRYNGTRIDTFRPIPGDSTSIYNNNIRTVCGDGRGKLYIICKYALCEFDLRTEKFRTIVENGIRAINHNRDDLWACTSDMVYRCTEQGLEEYFATGVKDNITCVYELSNGHVLVGTAGSGLISIDKNRKATVTLPAAHVINVYEDSKKNLWICTRNSGLYRIDGNNEMVNYIHSEDPSSLSDNFVRTVCEDDYGNYWIGTFKGINVLNPETKTIIRPDSRVKDSHSLPHSSVWSIIKDRQGTLWIGTYFGGISTYNRKYDFYAYHDRYFANPLTAVISAISEDGSGNLWVASEDTGLMKAGRGDTKIKEYNQSNGLSSGRIKSLYYDGDENALWVGTLLGGLNRLDLNNESIRVFNHKSRDRKSLPNNNIRKILPYGDYLIIATNAGAVRFDKTTYSSTPISDSPLIADKYIADMLLDSRGNCWVAVSAGVVKVNLETGLHTNYFFEDKSLIGSNYIISSYEDSKGRIWLGSSGSGLFLYEPGTDSFSLINSSQTKLINDYILGIGESGAGYILLVTNQGFVRYDHENNIFYNYNKYNGFPISDITSYGLFVSSDNEIYVCGYKSLVSFREKDLMVNLTPTGVFFTSLRVNNKPVNVADESDILSRSMLYQKEVHLRPRHTVFAVECATANYIPYSRTTLEYRLAGFDDEWIKGTVGQPIAYTNLQPRTYKLHVRSLDSHTNSILATNMLTVVVHPPFHKTVWAYLILFLAAAAIVIVLARFYISKVRLNASLELEKMEKKKIQEMNRSKLQFFTYVSHELRTPVTLIQSQVEYILQKHNVPPFIYNKVLGIQRNLLKMNKLINELLDFKKQEQEFQQISFVNQDIVPLLNKIFLAFKEFSVSKNIDFTFVNEAPDETAELWFEAEQLEKVFYNLISNAFKYTPEGGKISMHLYLEGDNLVVKINDTGEGIDSAYQKSIFDPFFQVPASDQAAVGTGLGLTIARGIVKAHYGEITLLSQKGVGSTFTVSLPLGDSHIPAGAKRQVVDEDRQCVEGLNSLDKKFIEEIVSSQKESGTHNATIMIVEDNDELRHYLAVLFEPIYTVITAKNGLDAWQKLEHNMPDIILSDLMMPAMDGNELCIKVKNNINTSHIPFVMLTAKVAEESELEGFRNGADDYISKPFNTKILITKCNNLVNTRMALQNKFAASKSVRSEMIATNAIDKEFIDNAIKIVMDNIMNPNFDVVNFASEMAMGRTKFFMKLKGITGQTPNKFVTNIRLKKSIELMEQNLDLSIGEISYMVGFNSPSYFIKSFKTLYGITPSQYKNNLKDQGDSGHDMRSSERP